MSESSDLVTTPKQLNFNLTIVAEKEIDGVGMGVLTDGQPFLTLRGLARMCGVDNASIVRMTANWMDTPLKPREAKIRELVRAQARMTQSRLLQFPRPGSSSTPSPGRSAGRPSNTYAFEAQQSQTDQAAKSYRILARKGFSDFIYAQVGYNPSGSVSVAWQQFHDRVGLSYHTVPDGYFSIFKEMSDMLVTMIREGADLGSSFIPDISVGQHWAKYWNAESLDIIYGERIKDEHNYPNYFPQSASNPQASYCYPNDALGEFRKWMREQYIPAKLPTYLGEKVKQGQIPAHKATAAIAAFGLKKLKKA